MSSGYYSKNSQIQFIPESSRRHLQPHQNFYQQTERAKIASEIETTGQPYKEIEVLINNNRMVLRIQKMPVDEPEMWDPICDCPTDSPGQLQQKLINHERRHVNAAFPSSPSTFKSSEIFRPQRPGDPAATQSPEVIQNPNVFLLKIKKRSETWDKRKEFIDLEFRTPRPWPPRTIQKKTKKLVQNNLIDAKQISKIIEESLPVAETPQQNNQKEKKNGKTKKKGKKKRKK